MAYRPKRTRRKMNLTRRRKSKIPFPSFSFLNMTRQQFLFRGILGIILLAVVGYISVFILFLWYGRDLPEPGKLSESRENSTVFYDRNGEVLYELYEDKNRVSVESEEIPQTLKQATVAIEDKDFYQHEGISQRGILRAAVMNLLGRPQGGSTITQQLIKNVLLTSERKLSRKIKEAILAFEVEKRYTKDEILTMYLNEAPYGGSLWGVGSATKAYFDKEVSELSLVESAILAGLPQRPSYYSPFINEDEAWKERAVAVLRRMREDDYISKDQEKTALTQLETIRFASPKITATAPHFVFYIKNLIEEQFGAGLLNQGVKITTTIDAELQKEAENIVEEEILSLEDYNVGNGALIAIEPDTGEIIAYVGSYDFNNEEYGKFDVVSQGNRQPGSALKPIEYAVALDEGYTPSSVIMDVKTVFPNVGEEDYVPENYDLKYRGPVQLRFALGNSLNVPAVKLLAMVGIRDFLQQGFDMGLSSFEPTNATINNLGLSASLGGGETTLYDLTSAYGVFANGGELVEPAGILSITDFNGKEIYKKDVPNPRKVLSEEISFLISHILSDNNARIDTFGPSSYLTIAGNTVAVKTGTTNDKRDNWTVGYTKSIVMGVWVGNNDNSPMNQQIASGITGASPIWNAFMKELLSKYEDGIIDKPDDVIALEVDAFLGGLPRDGYPTRSEYFISGTEPTEQSPFYTKLKISKANGKLANDVEIKTGNYDEKDFIRIEEFDPISTDGKNRWQEAIDEWARAQDDEKFHYPTETSDAQVDEIAVRITSPKNNERIDSNSVKVDVEITTLEDVKEATFWIDDKEEKKISGTSKSLSETFDLEDGTHKIRVEARNVKDKTRDTTITIGIHQDVQDE